MVDVENRGIEERHEAVAQELIHVAAGFGDQVGEQGVIVVENMDDIVWGQFFRQRREIGEIQKEDGNHLARRQFGGF